MHPCCLQPQVLKGKPKSTLPYTRWLDWCVQSFAGDLPHRVILEQA